MSRTKTVGLDEMFRRRGRNHCPGCDKDMMIHDNRVFSDELSQEEYNISGLCQECQDVTFQEAPHA